MTISAAAIEAQGQGLTPLPGAVAIVISNGAIEAQGQALTINAPAGTSIVLDTAAVEAQGQGLTLSPGAVAVTLAVAEPDN